jgi:hypothetical protein
MYLTIAGSLLARRFVPCAACSGDEVKVRFDHVVLWVVHGESPNRHRDTHTYKYVGAGTARIAATATRREVCGPTLWFRRKIVGGAVPVVIDAFFREPREAFLGFRQLCRTEEFPVAFLNDQVLHGDLETVVA